MSRTMKQFRTEWVSLLNGKVLQSQLRNVYPALVDRPTQLICICQQSVGNLLIQHTWFQGNCCRSSGCKIELHEPTKDQETYCTQLDPIWTYLMYGRWIQCKPVVMSAPREAIVYRNGCFSHIVLGYESSPNFGSFLQMILLSTFLKWMAALHMRSGFVAASYNLKP